MDFLIDDWKQDPYRNADFASGKRILLSPYFITVTNLTIPYLKYTCLVFFENTLLTGIFPYVFSLLRFL